MTVTGIVDGQIEVEDSGLYSKASIDLTTIKRYYASKLNDGRNTVILIFDDGDNAIVFDEWKEVQSAMKPIKDHAKFFYQQDQDHDNS